MLFRHRRRLLDQLLLLGQPLPFLNHGGSVGLPADVLGSSGVYVFFEEGDLRLGLHHRLVVASLQQVHHFALLRLFGLALQAKRSLSV